jgi:hypothetical protein
MGDRSMTTPPSVVPKPGALCPPPRTASSRPDSRAKFTPRDHVGNLLGLDHYLWVLVDAAVMDRSCVVIAGIRGGDYSRADLVA